MHPKIAQRRAQSGALRPVLGFVLFATVLLEK
jgi:hypothetical protein